MRPHRPAFINGQTNFVENYSRASLAGGLSRTQDLTAFLIVLFAAVRQHGVPEALISDSGSIFLAKEARRIYRALQIGAVWLCGEHLTVHFAEEPLAQYQVSYQRDQKGLKAVTNPRLFETQFRSPQLALWELGPDAWHLVLRLPEYVQQRRASSGAVQPPLFALEIVPGNGSDSTPLPWQC